MGVCQDKGAENGGRGPWKAPNMGVLTIAMTDWWTNLNHEAPYWRVEKPQVGVASEAITAQSGQALTDRAGMSPRRFIRLSYEAFARKRAEQCYECIVTPN